MCHYGLILKRGTVLEVFTNDYQFHHTHTHIIHDTHTHKMMVNLATRKEGEKKNHLKKIPDAVIIVLIVFESESWSV